MRASSFIWLLFADLDGNDRVVVLPIDADEPMELAAPIAVEIEEVEQGKHFSFISLVFHNLDSGLVAKAKF